MGGGWSQAVTNFDVPFVGVLHGIGDEVGDDLLYALLVGAGEELGFRIVCDEFHPRLGDALSHRLAHLVEESREVKVFNLYALWFLVHLRRFQQIVDESKQQVAVVADDVYKLRPLFSGRRHVEQVGESHDGVQRCAYLVGHVGQEGSLQGSRLLGTGRFAPQFLLGAHQTGNVAADAEMSRSLSVLVEGGCTADGEIRLVTRNRQL